MYSAKKCKSDTMDCLQEVLKKNLHKMFQVSYKRIFKYLEVIFSQEDGIRDKSSGI